MTQPAPSITVDNKLVRPVTFRQIDYGNLVRRAWGVQWGQRDIVYRFSNDRIFRDSFTQGGPYA